MKTEIPVRKVSQKVKRPAPAGWAGIRKTMQARLMAPALAALGLLKPGEKLPRTTTTKRK
jgi:hypothetical protein